MKVHVYWNFNRLCWSVRAAEGPRRGRVVAYQKIVHLVNCRLIVQQAGLAKARETGVKNVHAYVKGEWIEGDQAPEANWGAITYNPFREGRFVWRETGQALSKAAACRFEIQPDHRPNCTAVAEPQTG